MAEARYRRAIGVGIAVIAASIVLAGERSDCFANQWDMTGAAARWSAMRFGEAAPDVRVVIGEMPVCPSGGTCSW